MALIDISHTLTSQIYQWRLKYYKFETSMVIPKQRNDVNLGIHLIHKGTRIASF
jgi:hypothetical protein